MLQEYVKKKKKLQVEKQKREILLDEVRYETFVVRSHCYYVFLYWMILWPLLSDFRFLRQRHKYLTKLQFAKVEPEHGPCQNIDTHDVSIRKESNHIANEVYWLCLTQLISLFDTKES